MKVWITQLRRGLLEFCLLNLLKHGRNYGYQIVQQLEQIEELSVSESTVYPILARLKQEGYLKVKAVPSPGGPPRRYFSLTQIGESYVSEMNRYWENLLKAIERLKNQKKEEAIRHE